MKIETIDPVNYPELIFYRRCTIDLKTGKQQWEDAPCRNLEDVLGGFGRSFQMLAEREIKAAYCPENPLIINTGLLTGSSAMTGLRTYFSSYSPIKGSKAGLPAAMWSAGSGKFGAKFKWTGLDELILENCADTPQYIVIKETNTGPHIELKAAEHLLGLSTHDKIMTLYKEYPDAHFAAIGPAGENWQNVYMGSVALSTVNQLKSGDDKLRFAGRGGMGSIMGYKNIIALVAQSTDKHTPITPEVKAVHTQVIKGGGAARLQPIKRGGGGGTWAAYDVMQPFHAVPVNNYRPQGNDLPEKLFRENVEKEYDIESAACYRCGITCHNYIYDRKDDGSRGDFIAKFDYEPLNLLGTNIGIHDAGQAGRLIHLCDNYGVDAISMGVTISYTLSYNERHPEKPLFNGAVFGDYDKIRELIIQAGKGKLLDIGQGSMRLSEQTGETDYAYHIKGLEIAAYLPETNPGYCWAIAGGHMSMGSYGTLIREGLSDVDSWVKVITEDKLHIVGFDLIGLCKFFDITQGIGTDKITTMALEFRQGYTKSDFSFPAEVANEPNPNIELPNISNPNFMNELAEKVWAVFDKELADII